MTNTQKNINRLIKQIAKENVVPFIGSGFSLKAGAPGVAALKDAIVEDGGQDFAGEIDKLNKISLAELSEKYIEYNGGSRNSLLSILKKLFELEPKDLSDQEYLRKIPHFHSIYTTNYDSFIESAFPKSELLVVNSNESYSFVGSSPITLYKIHGDLSTLSSPDSVVISLSDYKEYFKGKRFENLWTQFKADAGKKTILFIGYSLEDSNIINIIKNVRILTGQSGKEWFLIAPNLNDSKIKQLKKYKITYIDGKAEDIFPQILDALKDTIDADYKHKRVKTETYSRFCELNAHFSPVTFIGLSKNQVIQYNPIKGTTLHHKFQMNLTKQFDLNNPAEYTSSIPFRDTLIQTPAICIPNTEMTSFDHYVNGITIAIKMMFLMCL